MTPIREKAGLGHPPKEYHNNSQQCINNVIKMKVKRERSILGEFSCKMKPSVEDQQNHLVRAFTCHGESCLYLAFPNLKWTHLHSLNYVPESTHINHVPKLNSATCKYVKKLASKNY